MKSINSLNLSGYLTNDFVMNNGVAKSSIAINTWNGQTFYVDLVAFKNKAEYVAKAKYKKGEAVVVSGELNVNVYKDKKYIQCVLNEISRLGENKNDEEDVVVYESGASLGQPTGDIDVSDDTPIDDLLDDTPF